MKKSILLFSVLALLFLSCSNNDDKNTPEEFVDPIIGNWHISAIVENDVGLVLFDCDLMQSIHFTEDKTGQSINPFFDGTNCILDTSSFLWKRINETQYELEFDLPQILNVEFSNNNTIIKISEPNNELMYFAFNRI